jgi:hypothetical protein
MSWVGYLCMRGENFSVNYLAAVSYTYIYFCQYRKEHEYDLNIYNIFKKSGRQKFVSPSKHGSIAIEAIRAWVGNSPHV